MMARAIIPFANVNFYYYDYYFRKRFLAAFVLARFDLNRLRCVFVYFTRMVSDFLWFRKREIVEGD